MDPNAGELLVDMLFWWDFGDPNGGNFTYGNSKGQRNIMTGVSAGHLYNDPGTYEINMTAFNGTSTANATPLSITVLDPNTVYAGARTICISADGTSAACPAGGTQKLSVTSWNAAFSDADKCDINDDPNVRCLFERGDVFTATATPFMANRTRVGAYGTGALPRVDISGDNIYGVNTGGGGDKKILDIHIVGGGVGSDGTRAVHGENCNTSSDRSHDVLIHGVTTTNFEWGFSFPCTHTTAGAPTQQDPNGYFHRRIAIIGNTLDDSDGGGASNLGNGLHMAVDNGWLIMDNNLFPTVRPGEHTLRTPYCDGCVIYANTWGEITKPRHHMKILGWGIELDSAGQPLDTRYYNIGDNYVRSGSLYGQGDGLSNDLLVDFGHNGGTGFYKRFHTIREWQIHRNFFDLTPDTAAVAIAVGLTCGNGIVNDNIFDLSAASGPDPNFFALVTGVDIYRKDPNHQCETDNIRIHGNTFYLSMATVPNDTPIGIRIQGSTSDNTMIQNNLFYASHASGAFDFAIEDNGTGTTFCDDAPTTNPGTCNKHLTSSDPHPFVKALPLSANPGVFTEYDIADPNSVLVDCGDLLPSRQAVGMGQECRVNDDGTFIHGTKPDCGAYEYNAIFETCPRSTGAPTIPPNIKGGGFGGGGISDARQGP